MGLTHENRFVLYDDSVRETLNESAQRALDQLRERFSRVEICGISEKEWCVRVIHEVHAADDPLPLAAIGKTPHLAAERLWRISTFYEMEPVGT